MPSVKVAADPVETLALSVSADTNLQKQTQQTPLELDAALYSITEQRSPNAAPTIAAVAAAAPALPLNQLDSFGAGTVVNTSA